MMKSTTVPLLGLGDKERHVEWLKERNKGRKRIYIEQGYETR